MQCPIDDPSINLFTAGSLIHPRCRLQRPVSRSERNRSRHKRTVLILQRSLRLISRRLSFARAILKMILARRTSSLRALRLRLICFKNRRSGGLRQIRSVMQTIIAGLYHNSMFHCTSQRYGLPIERGIEVNRVTIVCVGERLTK